MQDIVWPYKILVWTWFKVKQAEIWQSITGDYKNISLLKHLLEPHPHHARYEKLSFGIAWLELVNYFQIISHIYDNVTSDTTFLKDDFKRKKILINILMLIAVLIAEGHTLLFVTYFQRHGSQNTTWPKNRWTGIMSRASYRWPHMAYVTYGVVTSPVNTWC